MMISNYSSETITNTQAYIDRLFEFRNLIKNHFENSQDNLKKKILEKIDKEIATSNQTLEGLIIIFNNKK